MHALYVGDVMDFTGEFIDRYFNELSEILEAR